MKTKIFLDTNVLLAISQFNIDIFSEIDRVCDFSHELILLNKVEEELTTLFEESTGRMKQSIKLVISIINTKNLKKMKSLDWDTDTALLNAAKESTGIVATQDKGLKDRLREQHIPVLTIRQKKYMVLIKEGKI